MDAQQLIETWQINNRINLYLLDAVSEEHRPTLCYPRAGMLASNLPIFTMSV